RDRTRHEPGIAADDEVLGVAQVRHGPDAFAAGVVDADLRTDVALRVVRQYLDGTASSTHGQELVEGDPGLVVVRHDRQRRVDALDARPERVGHRAPAVEHA